MSPNQEVVETSRRTRRTLYVITSLYVGAGFFMAIPAAASGDRLSAFLGFLIISGAIAATVIINSLLRLSVRVGQLDDKIESFATVVGRAQAIPPSGPASPGEVSVTTSDSEIVDLNEGQALDPSALAAATLDRQSFPRLVTIMDDPPSVEPTFNLSPIEDATVSETTPDEIVSSSPSNGHGSLTIKNLMRSWAIARRGADVATCRSIYSTIREMGTPDIVATLGEQLDDVGERAKLALREGFAGFVRSGDIDSAMATGEKLEQLFPDSELAEDFSRLKPFLLERSQQTTVRN